MRKKRKITDKNHIHHFTNAPGKIEQSMLVNVNKIWVGVDVYKM